MYLGKRKGETFDSIGRYFEHTVHELECDSCHKHYDSRHSRAPQRKFHACSPECAATVRKRDGALGVSIAQTNIERYGAANVFASPIIKQRISDVVQERYGAPVITQTEHFKGKVKQTWLDKYGVECPSQSHVVQEKAKQTRIERFGVPYMMQLPRVQEALREGTMQKHGVPYNLQAPEVRKKIAAVLVERYGSLCSLTAPEVRAKAEETMVKLYGAVNFAQTAEFLVKRNETMKRNGSYGKSGPEDALYGLLCDTFGSDQIERQCLVNGHRVDFYVRSIDTYVELDGVYWHGLDRPLHEIRASDGPRDVGILRTYESDRHQDAWFSAHGMRLIRITDIEYRRSSAACLCRISSCCDTPVG